MQASPARILDIGTGTGAAALELADRYPAGEVVGIDVSAEMIAQAEAKAADLSGRVRFLVADIANFEHEERFDLIAMLNMPPFFDSVVALLRPGGFVVNASSYGSRTPFFTPPGLLKRGFERRGLRSIAVGQVGLAPTTSPSGNSWASGLKRSATAPCRRPRAPERCPPRRRPRRTYPGCPRC